ncbi:MAG: C-GCAxxG-C-C family protein [Candidatus Limnocylindrales bacterium]|jgi:C_GCAxxG_C_C family probable redox protein
MTADEAAARARTLFLDESNSFGCAETTFMVLKEAFGLPDPLDPSAAMALNGGVAYSGGVCGAISGASLAVGLLAARRFRSHARAKRLAREVIARLMDDFRAEHGAVDCRALVGREIRTPEQHRAFIDSGIWRVACMSQIEFVVRALASLPVREAWT